jgi:hypothetical protein
MLTLALVIKEEALEDCDLAVSGSRCNMEVFPSVRGMAWFGAIGTAASDTLIGGASTLLCWERTIQL